MKNKKILALAIASVLGLTACGEESTALRIDETISDSLNRQSSIAFDLISSTKVISTPTYLAMDATNGTLNIPPKFGDPNDLTDPTVAMGHTDGWSPTQPFIIKLDLPAGVTLTTDPALLHAAVKLAKVDVSSTKVMSNLVELRAGDDYTVISTGTSLAVLPLNGSLDHGSDYIYVITDALVDSSGEKLGMSTSYAALKNKQIDQTGGRLEVPQKIVWQVETLMDGYGIANYENIIYSSWFTTSSAGNALNAVKIATARTIAAGRDGTTIWPDNANALPAGKDLTGLYTFSNTELVNATNSSDILVNLAAQVAATLNVHTGTIKLPSFLERELATFSNTPWESATPSPVTIFSTLNDPTESAHLSGQLGSTDPTNILELIGKNFTKRDGSPLDSDRLITKYSPFAKVKDVEDVKFLLITPNNVPDGETVPVVIYQHGITSVKENILYSGNALMNGYAILAIDLPLHGERGILNDKGDDDSSNDEYYVADSDNADIFMNFGYLTVGRDNMRQAVADLIGLRAGLSLTGEAPFNVIDKTSVSFFGHSLGAMTGIGLQATIEEDLPVALSALEPYFTIDKAVFSNPGGGIPYLLLNSEEFGGTVKHGLMAASDTQDAESNGYINFIGAKCELGVVDTPDDNKPLKNNTACFNGYYNFIEDISPGSQAKIDETFQEFSIAAQTVLETVDPFALARNISDTTPIYLTQVNGDTVIPNYLIPNAGYAAPYSPIGGTEPLMAQLKLKNIYTFDTTKKTALFLTGEHSSAIVDATGHPDYPNADTATTNELQSHIANFLSGDGSTIGTVATSLLDPKVIPSLD